MIKMQKKKTVGIIAISLNVLVSNIPEKTGVEEDAETWRGHHWKIL